MPAPERPGLVGALRHATGGAHRRVETLLLPGGHADTPAAVVAVVALQARLLGGLGPALDGEHAGGTGALPLLDPDRRRAEDDLSSWSVSLPAAGDPPPGALATVAARAGARYVVEGARLGLRSLAGEAAAALEDAGLPPSSLLADAATRRGRWPAVVHWLEGTARHPADGGAFEVMAVAGALAVFGWVADLAALPAPLAAAG